MCITHSSSTLLLLLLDVPWLVLQPGAVHTAALLQGGVTTRQVHSRPRQGLPPECGIRLLQPGHSGRHLLHLLHRAQNRGSCRLAQAAAAAAVGGFGSCCSCASW
jgi:hypothetical protein